MTDRRPSRDCVCEETGREREIEVENKRGKQELGHRKVDLAECELILGLNIKPLMAQVQGMCGIVHMIVRVHVHAPFKQAPARTYMYTPRASSWHRLQASTLISNARHDRQTGKCSPDISAASASLPPTSAAYRATPNNFPK